MTSSKSTPTQSSRRRAPHGQPLSRPQNVRPTTRYDIGSSPKAPRDYASRPIWQLVLGLLVLVGALLAARMLLGARAELVRAEQAAHAPDSLAVDRHLRRCVAYYLPANPWVAAAVARLRHRARRADSAGDLKTALARWRALRGSLLALRGATQPYASLLPECNQRIAALTVAAVKGRGADEGARALRNADAERALLRRLERPDDPHPLWTLIGLLGFVGWVLGGLLLIARGLDPKLRWLPSYGRPALIMLIIGLSAFVAGMSLA